MTDKTRAANWRTAGRTNWRCTFREWVHQDSNLGPAD